MKTQEIMELKSGLNMFHSKDLLNSEFNCTENLPGLGLECESCLYELKSPFIVCDTCNINICVACFSIGIEFLSHKNDHPYVVFNDSLPIFSDTNWTAKEELKLLDVLIDCGNFNTVSRCLPDHTLEDVKNHYDYFYLRQKGSDLFPKFRNEHLLDIKPVIPYKFNVKTDASQSNNYTYQVGYNAARSEFETEYDMNAEDVICNLNLNYINKKDFDSEILSNLQQAIVSSYNRRLLERQRRKLVIRNHGLVSLRKVIAWLHRYDDTIAKKTCEKICRFMQFCTGMQFEFLMEGLHHSGELKAKIIRLSSYHKKGITTMLDAELYHDLKILHDNSAEDIKHFQTNRQLNWRISHAAASSLLFPICKRRKSFNPLNIEGLPGFEKLQLKERELCRSTRLVPLSYIEFRDILVNENKKTGYLKLLTARKLLKIDVNKTRRIYDFLAQEGYINKK